MKLPATFLLIVTLYIVNVSCLRHGFKNFICGETHTSKVLGNCDTDCKRQHGALEGRCPGVAEGDFNCKCKGRANHRYEASLMCRNQTDSYREVCNVDCLCNHGAKGGYCDWNLKACICRGDNNNNVNCPYDTIPDFAHFVLSRLGEEAIGPLGMKFIEESLAVNDRQVRHGTQAPQLLRQR